ncbi:MAG: glycosyltransferase family 2 protein [Gemmataceae bacterium]
MDALPQKLPASPPRPRATRRPLVSVCIVNWNCQAELRNCLRSLRPRRQRVRLEIIVIDNHSSDGAPEMVAREFPRVRLVRNPTNVGFARGCNQAARLARGRYLFFLNNDTVLPRETLARLVRFSREQPDAGLIGPRLRDGKGRIQCSARCRPSVAALMHRLALLRWTGLFRRAYSRYRGREEGGEQPRAVEVLMGAALLMPRRLYRQVGGWDEGYTFGGEDIDLCTRVARSHRVIYHPGIEILHLGRVSSRLHAGFATAHTLVGITRSVRQGGASRLALLLYKLAFTLDLPLRLTGQLIRLGWGHLRGRERVVARARGELAGFAYFLRHALVSFWKA